MAVNLNKVMLIGRAGTDPEMRYTANGSAMTTFRMAVNRNFRGPDGEWRENTDWFTVVCWRDLAERIGQNLTKGSRVYVEGRLQNRSWDGPDGQKRSTIEVVAVQVQALDRPAGAAPLNDDSPVGDMEPEDLPFE
jgi:single-strand DNA-binding protein